MICNLNRGVLVPLNGCPGWCRSCWPLCRVDLVSSRRTRTGRYFYAIGASPEAPGGGIRCPGSARSPSPCRGSRPDLAGLVYDVSRPGVDLGGYRRRDLRALRSGRRRHRWPSLLGGRGKPVHALLGGIVIAAVYNGLGLLGISTAGTEIATALVLLAAVSVDSLVRRRGTLTPT